MRRPAPSKPSAVSKSFLAQVQATVRRHTTLSSRPPVLVAASGGADSTALALALHALKFPVALAHVHHGIRGKTADGDMRFVQRLAARYGWSFFGQRFDVPTLAEENNESIEMAARRVRRTFLFRIAQENGFRYIATGHTADDQTETILLNLFRGTGLAGLSGIPIEAAEEGGICLIRPLRETSRAAITAFLKAHKQRWREDETNGDDFALRNRLRHDILPRLRERINPSVGDALQRLAFISALDDAALEEWRASALKKIQRKDGRWNMEKFHALPLAIQHRLIFGWMAEQGIPYEKRSFHSVENVSGHLPKTGWHVPAFSTLWNKKNAFFHTMENPPGVVAVPALGARIVVERKRGFSRDPAVACLSVKKMAGRPLIFRTWQVGDRMGVAGVGTRKLSDVFTDLKVEKAARNQWIVVECGGEVAALLGWRTAASFYVNDARDATLWIRAVGGGKIVNYAKVPF